MIPNCEKERKTKLGAKKIITYFFVFILIVKLFLIS